MEQLLVRPDEAAEMISVSRSMIYKMIAAGDVPSVRINTAIRVPVDGLRQWVKANSAPGAVAVAQG